MSIGLGKRLPLPAALAAAAWVGLGQAEALLRQFQQSGTQAYGVRALGGGWLPHPDDAAKAVALWKGPDGVTSGQARTFLYGYTLLDLALIGFLVWLVWAAATRIADADPDQEAEQLEGILGWNTHPLRRFRPLVWYAVFDVAEDVLRVVNFHLDGQKWLYLLGYLAEKVKFAAVLVVVLTLAIGVRQILAVQYTRGGVSRWKLRGPRIGPGAGPGPAGRVVGDPYPPLRRLARAVSALRGQVGLVTALAVLLLVDATGQVGDFFRRWSDELLNALLGTAGLALFALVVWSSGRRTVLPQESPPAHAATATRSSRNLVVVFVVALAGGGLAWILLGSVVAMSLAAVLGALLLLELFRRVAGDLPAQQAREEQAGILTRAAADAPSDGLRETYQAFGRFLAALPVAVVGIVVVRASVGPLLLSFHHGYDRGQALALLAIGLGLIAAACLLLPRLLGLWDTDDPPPALEKKHGILVGVVVLAVMVLGVRAVDAPETAGSLAVVTVAFSALGLAFTELQRLSEITLPPRGLVMLGFHRTPVFILVAAWFTVASLLDTSGHHDIRTTGGSPEEVALPSLWQEWMTQNCVQRSEAPVPLVFVIAHGGGIRAAYWTGSVLTSLLAPGASSTAAKPTTCATSSVRSHLFAISSISGGSVGAAAYLAQDDPSGDWYREALGAPDYAAVALARGLLVDLPRALIGFDADDRAGLLEQAWEERVPGLEKDYFTRLRPGTAADGTWMPLTLLNGTQAETGCRLNTSSVRLTASRLDDLVDCRSTVGRYRTTELAPGLRVPAAPVTVDAIAKAKACSVSFRVSTAALMSARWPYISPSGRFPCGDPWVSSIDGGYADNAGYAGFRALWDQLAPLIARHNAAVTRDSGANLVVPVLVVVDNHYQSIATAAEPGRTPELLVPPLGELRAGQTRGPDREQAAISLVGTSPPGAAVQCTVSAYDPDPTDEEPGIGRVLLAPTTRPGLPAPLAWTLASSSRHDLDTQRDDLFTTGVGATLRAMLAGRDEAAVTCP